MRCTRIALWHSGGAICQTSCQTRVRFALYKLLYILGYSLRTALSPMSTRYSSKSHPKQAQTQAHVCQMKWHLK